MAALVRVLRAAVLGRTRVKTAARPRAAEGIAVTDCTSLPPGQHGREDFPRFGLGSFAKRFPEAPDRLRLTVSGDLARSCVLDEAALSLLPRVEQTSDFHCVTTWSTRSLAWSGYRFRDFHAQIVVPRSQPERDATFVVFRGQDGYAASLPLTDLLADDVLLADRLEGDPLPLAHGAPLRLIAPAHYGYKNPKHLCGIEFWRDARHYRFPSLRWMDHPRARVALEERGRGLPGWFLRYVYRPLVGPTSRLFHRELRRYRPTAAAPMPESLPRGAERRKAMRDAP